MMQELAYKRDKLMAILGGYPNLAVGFSGGVDSTLLLRAAREALGKERVLAITAAGIMCPQWEREQARALAAKMDVRQVEIPIDPMAIKGFRENTQERCYHCKRALFGKIVETAAAQGFRLLADGANADDLGDYRPGMRAVKELGIVSPLLEAGLTKADIRELSRQYGLSTAEKPSYACLASRIPYGTPITAEALLQVERAENFLMDRGFVQMRVRHHGEVARIEVPQAEIGRFLDEELREAVTDYFKEVGFRYVALDLQGFRAGSMNEGLKLKGE